MKKKFYAVNPKNGEKLYKPFYDFSESEINSVIKLADTAFLEYSKTDNSTRSFFLKEIAAQIELLGDKLIEVCVNETGLTEQRLIGERLRTVNQLKLFADYIQEGSYIDVVIDNENSDIRRMLIPIGPVAVFGSSNFPLAFSTAGGDTASALAAGCPVIFKAHPSHPNTSELIYSAIKKAIEIAELPEGVFGMLQGKSNSVGERLVLNPSIKAVGFTGSLYGGTALYKLATNRKEPIPVFAEMGSINPIFVLNEISDEKTQEFITGLVDSFTLGAGQFCTNPGVIITLKSEFSEVLTEKIKRELIKRDGETMLNSGINFAFNEGIKRLNEKEGIVLVSASKANFSNNTGVPHFYRTSAKYFLENDDLQEECFGPLSINVVTDNMNDMVEIARKLKGQLTASIFGKEDNLSGYEALIGILKNKVGRLIFNGFPTGVEVNYSMNHGGPFPATTDSRYTSVGINSIKRFLRPICYQNYPQELLPMELRDSNLEKINRTINRKIYLKN